MSGVVLSGQAHRLIVAIRNFAKAPKIYSIQYQIRYCVCFKLLVLSHVSKYVINVSFKLNSYPNGRPV
jgi:hypothetical protein